MGKLRESAPIVLGSPSPRQKLFLTDSHKYVAFGGARGGGKSWAVRTKALLLALTRPKMKIMIVRRTYAELRQNHIIPLCETVGNAAVYRETYKELSFENGSVIMFRYCRNEEDLQKFQGNECDALFIDEATQFTEEMFKRLCATVRGTTPVRRRVYLTCNPGGRGHSFVKRLFIDRNYREGENGEDYSFIKSLVTDNKALLASEPDYMKTLESLPPKLKKAWLYGDWDVFEGQFFEEFRNDEKHYGDGKYTHVIAPFEIPRDWQIYRSFDFGYSRPFSVCWWAVDYEGRAYLIRELYGTTGEYNAGVKWDPDRIFSEVRRIETEEEVFREKKIFGVADPSIWDASRGESIVEAADRHFVHFTKGDNKRIPGWMQCHYRLAFDGSGRPFVYFFSTCRNAIRTLPTLTFSKSNPEDLDTEGEDHFADSFRYFCMCRPISPRREKKEEESPPAGKPVKRA